MSWSRRGNVRRLQCSGSDTGRRGMGEIILGAEGMPRHAPTRGGSPRGPGRGQAQRRMPGRARDQQAGGGAGVVSLVRPGVVRVGKSMRSVCLHAIDSADQYRISMRSLSIVQVRSPVVPRWCGRGRLSLIAAWASERATWSWQRVTCDPKKEKARTDRVDRIPKPSAAPLGKATHVLPRLRAGTGPAIGTLAASRPSG